MTYEPSVDQLRSMPPNKIRTIMSNARTQSRLDIVKRCEKVLFETNALERHRGDYVVEFHFVCRNDENVQETGQGTFWSGNWWVDEDHARLAPRVGAVLALHEDKSQLSYRQGYIDDWKQVISNEPGDKQQVRVCFLVRETEQPLAWAGEGSGEKGYKRGPAQRTR